MKHKSFFSLILIHIFLLVSSLPVFAAGKETFSPDNVLKTIQDLSSKEYRGRLTGDKGNLMTQDYIQKYFKKLGLEPAGDNKGYLQGFDIIVPSLKGECFLKVLDKDKTLIKEYSYGTDFKENPYGASSQGTVYGQGKTELSESGNILLLSKGRISEMAVDYEMDIAIKEKGVKAIIYASNMNYRFRSPYKLQASYPEGLVKLIVTKKVFDELADFTKKGYTLEVKSPLQLNKIRANNVIGMIKGKKPELPPLILSAHFDHVGLDADGVLYPGALDNASGTAVLLEAARVIKSLKGLERTVIFAAFNGEEVGLVGSQHFVHNPPMNIKEAECINFDMVATSLNMPLSILSYGSDESFSRELEDIAKVQGIKTSLLNENNSDHGPFCVNGIKAVTLIYDDVTKIHTPKDGLENINKNSTQAVFSLVSSYLNTRDIDTVFSYESSDKRSKNVFLIVSLGFVGAFSLILFSKYKNIKQSR